MIPSVSHPLDLPHVFDSWSRLGWELSLQKMLEIPWDTRQADCSNMQIASQWSGPGEYDDGSERLKFGDETSKEVRMDSLSFTASHKTVFMLLGSFSKLPSSQVSVEQLGVQRAAALLLGTEASIWTWLYRQCWQAISTVRNLIHSSTYIPKPI